MLALIAGLPQPLKALYWTFLLVFAAGIVTFFLGSDRTADLMSGLLGVVTVLIGLAIVSDLNSGAEALAEATESCRPLGIDYSRSLLASPRFTRLFGLMMLFVGAVFVAGAVTPL